MLIINVTENDIINGDRNHCKFCPVALAIKRALPEVNVFVLPHSVSLRNKLCRLPEIAQRFISLYDGGIKVQPFSFELNYDPGNAQTSAR